MRFLEACLLGRPLAHQVLGGLLFRNLENAQNQAFLGVFLGAHAGVVACQLALDVRRHVFEEICDLHRLSLHVLALIVNQRHNRRILLLLLHAGGIVFGAESAVLFFVDVRLDFKLANEEVLSQVLL
jgi:hypothetical protein